MCNGLIFTIAAERLMFAIQLGVYEHFDREMTDFFFLQVGYAMLDFAVTEANSKTSNNFSCMCSDL